MASVSIRDDGSIKQRAEKALNTEAGGSGTSPAPDGKYPPGLIAEYQRLALMALTTPLTADEQTRLQALMEQIVAIDQEDPQTKTLQARYEALDARLERMRLKAETLLSAKR